MNNTSSENCLINAAMKFDAVDEIKFEMLIKCTLKDVESEKAESIMNVIKMLIECFVNIFKDILISF